MPLLSLDISGDLEEETNNFIFFDGSWPTIEDTEGDNFENFVYLGGGLNNDADDDDD